MDSKVLNLRLDTSECETLDGLAGKALNRQAVARMLLIAAIEAVQANGNMVHLPPRFRVDDGTENALTPPNSGRPGGSQSVAAAVVSTAVGSLPSQTPGAGGQTAPASPPASAGQKRRGAQPPVPTPVPK